MKKQIARSWEDVAELVKRRAVASSDGEAHVIVRLIEMDVEVEGGGRVHDVYEGLARYDADDELSGDALVKAVRESYSENEEYMKEYKTERGVKNFMSRSVEVPYVDGIIVQ